MVARASPHYWHSNMDHSEAMLLSALHTSGRNSDLEKTLKSKQNPYSPLPYEAQKPFSPPFSIRQYPIFTSVSFSTMARWCIEEVFYHLLQLKTWRICPQLLHQCKPSPPASGRLELVISASYILLEVKKVYNMSTSRQICPADYKFADGAAHHLMVTGSPSCSNFSSCVHSQEQNGY